MAIVDVDAALAGDSDLTANGQLLAKPVAGVAGSSTLGASLTVVTGYAAPLRYNPPPRSVQAGRMVLDQIDLFEADGKTRSQGVVPNNLLLRVYVGAIQLAWPLVTGVGIPDVQIAAGRVYFNEFSTGFYNIRFFPNMVGLWRVIVTYPAFDQATSFTYEVVPQGVPGALGLRSSFVRRAT